jgi:hypothetical protein
MRFATVASAMNEPESAAAGAGEDVHGEDLLAEVGPRGAVAARRPVVLPLRFAGREAGRATPVGGAGEAGGSGPHGCGATRGRALALGAKTPW